MALDAKSSTDRRADLYRMVMPEHVCPYGLKTKALLEREGFTVDDHPLETRDATEAFKREHGVKSTPQTFIDGRRIGGYEDVRAHFGEPVADPDATSYRPVIAIFAVVVPDGAGDQLDRARDDRAAPHHRVVHRSGDVPARRAEAAGRRELQHDVPQLRPARAPLGAATATSIPSPRRWPAC